MQIAVSHQTALSVLSDDSEQQVQHIVKACDIISQYEKTNSASTENLLLKFVCALYNKNLVNSDENGVSQSLRAYLCQAIINWFREIELNEEKTSECINLIIPILDKCVGDLFNRQSVQFWTTKSEINKLESQLSSSVGQCSIILNKLHFDQLLLFE